ncbi:MAG: response regulator [Chitinophagaceae bacterium]
MPDQTNHILIIDDNEDILFMLQTMLQIKGYSVTIKKNMDNLPEYSAALSPGVIIMDMLLSGADGREVCRALKADTTLARIPVVMISAHPNAREECLAAGANYFIYKPFEMMDLFNTVAQAINA